MFLTRDYEQDVLTFQNVYDPFVWKTLSFDSNLYLQFLERFIYKDWDFNILTNHKCITCNFIMKYYDKDWNWNKLSRKPDLNLSYVKLLKHKDWDWFFIFKRFIENFPELRIPNWLSDLAMNDIKRLHLDLYGKIYGQL